jgi:glycosyltransferase involved in cell wall biosynthesis/ubiquinone/menaquinone biosynthesis C-methylase UbiE
MTELAQATEERAREAAAGGDAGEVLPEDASIAAFFDEFAASERKWRRRNRTYHRLIEAVYRFIVPAGETVLEIGSGSGDLLAALEPDVGVGCDVSAEMVELASRRHPELVFLHSSGERLDAGLRFDYIILSDLVPFAHDLVALFDALARHAHPGTRIVVNSYSQLWRPIIRLAELLGLKARKPVRNWVAPEDVENVLELTGFEVVTMTRRILMPKQIPLLSAFLNGVLANVWPFHHLCLTYWMIARPSPQPSEETGVTVVAPARNEAGHIAALVERLPTMGKATELIFVEGGSQDDTRAEIERQIARHRERDISLIPQMGRGKGDAVRTGFAAAKHDVLMILDSDLSVAPEDLPKFYRALVDGRADLVNGSRLVYDLHPGAMRFLNMVANKLFSLALRLIIGQYVKDTLCGTKALRREQYERIAAGRDYFGDFDPFGDFDLLLGAGRLGLKIVDLPVRYYPRRYGETNIRRFRHGLVLLRMTAFAFWKFRVLIYRLSRTTRQRNAATGASG